MSQAATSCTLHGTTCTNSAASRRHGHWQRLTVHVLVAHLPRATTPCSRCACSHVYSLQMPMSKLDRLAPTTANTKLPSASVVCRPMEAPVHNACGVCLEQHKVVLGSRNRVVGLYGRNREGQHRSVADAP